MRHISEPYTTSAGCCEPIAGRIATASDCNMPLRPKRGYTFGNFRTNHQVSRARATVIRYVVGARPYGLHTLVIVGSGCSGKTHLLNAAGHAAQVCGQFGSTMTLTAARLLQLVEDGLYFGDWSTWMRGFIQTEWLAIDDIDQLGQNQMVSNLISDVLYERSKGSGRTLVTVGTQTVQAQNSVLSDFLLDVPAIPMIQEQVS